MFKKLHLFLVSLLLLGATTASANGTLVGELYYIFDGTNATVTYPGDAQPTSGNNAYTGDIEIPATVTHGGTTYNVTAIGDYAFQYSTITSLTMHEGLQTVGRWSISSISTITELTFPNSVTTLGSGVSDPLSGNSNLQTIVFGTGLTSIGQGFLFASSGNVKDIYFNAPTAPNVGGYFCNSVNKSTINIHVKETATVSYKKKFNGYGLASRVIGDIADDTPFIPLNYTYDSTNKTATVVAPTSGVYNRSITIPETVEYGGESYTVTTIGSGAFANSNITALVIPGTITRIEGTNFNNVCLNELRIPNSVTYISGAGDSGSGAIIPTIYIGSGIQTISGSFMYNAAVSDVYIYAVDPPSTGVYSFSINPTIHIYEGRLSAYQAVPEWATVWSSNRNLIDDIEKDYYTYDEFFAKKTELESLTPGVDPGLYTTTSYAGVTEALSATASINSSSSTTETTAAMKSLLAAEKNLVINDIEEGYYFITSAGNGCGYYSGSTPPTTNYNYEDINALYNDGGKVMWKAFDRTDMTQLYRFTANGTNWNVYNPADNTYINKTTGSGSTVSTSITSENAQKFLLTANCTGKYTIISTDYCYSLNGSHNGSTAASGELRNWGSSAEAIKFGVNVWYIHKATEAEVEAIKKAIAKESLEDAISSGVGYVGGMKDNASLTAAQALLAGSPTLAELQYALDNYVINFTDGYYRIVYPYYYGGADANNYLRFGNDLKLYADLAEGNLSDYSTVFKANIISTETRAAGSGYRMTLMSQGLCPTDAGYDTHQTMADAASQFAIAIRHNETLAEFLIGISNAAGNYVDTRYIYKKPQGEGWKIYSTGGNAKSARCYIVPATDITITLHAAESNYWGTLYVPFDVQLPTGNEAFVGKLSGNALTLTSIGQNIPAGTPVIIKGNAASITADIVSGLAAITDDNDLQGQYLAATAADETKLALGQYSGKVGFYKYTDPLGANKAYVAVSGGTPSAGFQFVFDDDDLTGLSNVQSSMLNAESYYDLFGRKVATPQKGQLYIQNGKVVRF